MFKWLSAHIVKGGLLAVVAMALGCDARSPSTPSQLRFPAGPGAPGTPATLTVTAIAPNSGLTVGAAPVTIFGTGFQVGANVTFDDVPASVRNSSDTMISATYPAHASGTVDVVVTNPGGESARLRRAFTYVADGPFVLTSSLQSVAPGAELRVSWTAPRGGPSDWIGFFPVTEPNINYGRHWWRYTQGALSGSFTLTAPSEPGQYEFRYLLDDGFDDVVRSSPVTVGANGASVRKR